VTAQQALTLSGTGSSFKSTGDFTVNGDGFVVTAANGNTDVKGDLNVDGTTTLWSGLAEGDLAVGGTKFVVQGSTGDTTTQGSLSVNSHTRGSVDADPTYGTSTVTGDMTVVAAGTDDTLCVGACDKFSVTPDTGAVQAAGTTTVSGDLTVNGDKFLVEANTGNTEILGSLSVNGAAIITGATTMQSATTVENNLSVGTDKFAVTAADGDTDITGSLAVNGDVTVNANNLILGVAKTPTSATETCTQGHIAWDNGFLYVCVETDTWKRASMVDHAGDPP